MGLVRLSHLVRDALGLVSASAIPLVDAIVGMNFGSYCAACAAGSLRLDRRYRSVLSIDCPHTYFRNPNHRLLFDYRIMRAQAEFKWKIPARELSWRCRDT